MKYKYGSFLATVLILFLVALIGPYFAIRSHALYCTHTRVFWNPMDCVKFGLHGKAADIVFVGDSSLVFGVRPNLIQDGLRMSALNLGQPAGAMIFFPGMLLDHYLAHNARPRLIVLYVGPWTLVQDQKGISHLWDDGARVAIRHGSAAQLADVFAPDPRRLLRVPILFLQQGLQQFSLSEAWWHAASAELRDEGGWFAIWRPGRPFSIERPGGPHPVPPTLASGCALAAKPVGQPDRAQIRHFRARYQRDGTRVIVYVAPVPRCDASHPAIVAAYTDVSDNRPRTLPSADFIDDGWRVHVTREGARQATAQVIAFLKTTLVAASPGHVRDGHS
ncbi:hypothetical protein [Lichenicoccus sp.]|uniref:hypothetical protein n=1 Tax=Lichenicoccus sp. TaxID=2781899 RepID=UPI003D0DB8C8